MKHDDLTPGIIEQADIMSLKVQEAQEKAAIKNAVARHQERMRKYRAWVTPEAIKERKERFEREAIAALEQGLAYRKAHGLPDEDEPIPADLPAHMKGQSPSTIRAMMRHEKISSRRYEMIIMDEPAHAIANPSWWRQIISWFKH